MYKCGQRQKGLFYIFLIAVLFYQIFVLIFTIMLILVCN